MFSLGQILVLGLASSIYVVGAAFLLGGRSMLRRGGGPSADADGGQAFRAGTREGAPYFIPVLDGDATGARSRNDSASPAPRRARGRPARRSVARGEATEGVSASLRNPICLN